MSSDAFDTLIRTVDAASLAFAQKIIQGGDVVAVPTETVYGLAADATKSSAVSEIYAAKGRPSFNPLIVHVGRKMTSTAALAKAGIIDESVMTPAAKAVTQKLMDLFWPGPLTIVMPRGDRVVDEAVGGLDTVALRMPAHPTFLALIELAGVPLAAPSANRSKRISPTTAAHVMTELGGRIPLILDGGPAEVGVESTIVAPQEDGSVRLLRPGGLPVETITQKAQVIWAKADVHASETILAPGMMLEHYAPSKPLLLMPSSSSEGLAAWLARDDGLSQEVREKKVGVLLFGDDVPVPAAWQTLIGNAPVCKVVLSEGNAGADAARQLFSAVRALDESSVAWMIVQYPEQKTGLWPAIRDRLARAAARWRTSDFPLLPQ